MSVVDVEPAEIPGSVAAAVGLLEMPAGVVDPRRRQGRRFGLPSVLAVALAATLTGARTFVAISEWAADLPETVLSRLGLCAGAPSETTIRRVLQRLDADSLDSVVCGWMWLRAKAIGGVKVISFDGKTLKGARDAAGSLAHLLSGICQITGTIVAQVEVDGKTSEVPMMRKLVKTLADIAGCVFTMDALHTCRETAQDIVDRSAHYVLVVKANQPTLRATLKALPWNNIPVVDRAKGKPAHGRIETRTVKATAVATGIDFPGAAQVLKITRTRTLISKHRNTREQTRETVYIVTSLAPKDANHHQIAAWLRGHWATENRTHWVRDVTFDEDRHQARTGSAPHVLATLRNTAISLLRLAGHTNIAQATRHQSRDAHRPLELLLTS